MNNLTLYELTNDYTLALRQLSEADDLPVELVNDTLESLLGDFEEKAKNVAAFVLNTQAEAASMKQYEERMQKRRKRVERVAERLKEYLKLNMEKVGLKNIAGREVTLSLRNNPPSVVVEDEEALDVQFLIPKLTINKSALGNALKNGQFIEGARLEHRTSLQIKH